MTDDYTSSYPHGDGGSGTDGGASTADTAKEQAKTLKENAAGAGGHLVGEAKSEAAAVTQEARRQLSDLWTQARTEVTDQASSQQTRLAGGLTAVGGQLTQMASAPEEQNFATDIVREVGDRVDALGQWLENHGPDEVLEEVRTFARRRPGTFLLVAAGAGVVIGRLTRGLKDATPTSSTSASPATTSVPTAQPVAEPTEVLPVYADVAQERPQLPDEVGSPVPSTTGWDQR
ncbi:hypothetical protein [Cellulomonas fengjieae]|uniref:DUF3618 domain-containing protein n=1 Tax=Cellulomonas fengjieae TaxID=2819978 RepID=A0ABS3SIS9_9CELL|nr:hypothetical protein [Cellulomonas fengjieae]MBO3085651.1 hypothetical protein [Cellulomonas fengjieae]MBO3102760.1 hypothetical protein [Cellulomonas fengjieae]QVI67634.1 hypothetical protein KG102_08800 [Cellulomonas fengjieae]